MVIWNHMQLPFHVNLVNFVGLFGKIEFRWNAIELNITRRLKKQTIFRAFGSMNSIELFKAEAICKIGSLWKLQNFSF